MDEIEDAPRLPRSKLSKTPSWITLGFLFGVLFVWSLPDPTPSPERTPATPTIVTQLERPKLTEIEAVFADWDQPARWEHEITEVALWDTAKQSYSLYFEVLRNGSTYYFRSIPRLTRPVLKQGVPANSPLQYTEPGEIRRTMWERSESAAVPPPPATIRPELTAPTTPDVRP